MYPELIVYQYQHTNIPQVFLSCPHRVPDRDSFIDRIAVWLGSKLHATSDGLVSITVSLASSILEINGLFFDTRMILQSRIVNVFSEHPDPLEQVCLDSVVIKLSGAIH